jgi:hypothetical protein
VAVSEPVRSYYAARIWANSGRGKVPRNFAPLEGAETGRSAVEGCAGGGKNILEIRLCGDAARVKDVRASCGLCNPAMYAAADILCEWARGRAIEEVLAIDPEDPASLDPFFTALGGEGRPDDAREKFQYALLAVQNAVRVHRGESPAPLPRIARAAGSEEEISG